jgi:hypothetical protein
MYNFPGELCTTSPVIFGQLCTTSPATMYNFPGNYVQLAKAVHNITFGAVLNLFASCLSCPFSTGSIKAARTRPARLP